MLSLVIGQSVPPKGGCADTGKGSSCLDPLFVKLCDSADFEHACAFDNAGNKIRDVTIRYLDTGAVVCDFGSVTPYSGPPYDHIGACSQAGGGIEEACAFDSAGNWVADVMVDYSTTPPVIYNYGTRDPYSGPGYDHLGKCTNPIISDSWGHVEITSGQTWDSPLNSTSVQVSVEVGSAIVRVDGTSVTYPEGRSSSWSQDDAVSVAPKPIGYVSVEAQHNSRIFINHQTRP